jgi:pimeloyl-ACP methyl ester carboxylesterase
MSGSPRRAQEVGVREQSVQCPDGRVLQVAEIGPENGNPVFFLHGTPGCRLGPHPRAVLLHHLNVRLIAYDRPGYGGSTRFPQRRVLHAAQDVLTIADSLGLAKFCVVGRSGGGPHALACAASLPRRVERAAALVSLAPRRAPGLDWYAGMTDSNDRAYHAAESGISAIEGLFEAVAQSEAEKPGSLLDGLGPELQPADRIIVGDNAIRSGIERAHAEAARNGSGGRADDAVSFVEDWGFDPAEIRVPTLLWHGAQDVFSPAAHTEWLTERISSAVGGVEHGAHFSAIQTLVDVVLPWFTAESRIPRPRRAPEA